MTPTEAAAHYDEVYDNVAAESSHLGDARRAALRHLGQVTDDPHVVALYRALTAEAKVASAYVTTGDSALLGGMPADQRTDALVAAAYDALRRRVAELEPIVRERYGR